MVFAGEVPFDNLDTYAQFRVACLEARFRSEGNFRNPPSGKMRVYPEDFVALTEFDPLLHCKQPGGDR